MSGIERGKFEVTHRIRGRLEDDDVFVLVPGRDPAAVSAIRAYARETDDVILSSQLESWADRVEGSEGGESAAIGDALDSLPVWVATLAGQVKSGHMTVETALQRIAGHSANAMLRRIAGE